MARRGRPRHPDILTPREWEVLALLREHLTNEQIAGRLGITAEGVKYHVSEILGKLGVASREEAARWQAVERRSWWFFSTTPLVFWRRLSVPWLSPALAVASAGVVAAGVGIGVLLLVRTGGNGSNEQVVVLATDTPTVFETATPTPSVATPTSTQPAATPTEPSAGTPTPDTRVAIRDLPRLDQIQLGSDGKYFVADRGDGCRWVEHARSVNEVAGESVVLSTDCPTYFGYEFYPATGGIFLLVP